MSEECKIFSRLAGQPSDPAARLRPETSLAEEQKPENRIAVSDQLRRPHPLVQAESAALSKSRSANQAAAASGSAENKPEPVLDIRVSPAVRGRALRIMDALLKALEARGYQVNARGVTIDGQLLPLAITEKDDRCICECRPGRRSACGSSDSPFRTPSAASDNKPDGRRACDGSSGNSR